MAALITVKIDAPDLQKYLSRAQRAKEALSNRSKPLADIKKKQIARWAQNFTGQGSLYGGWAGLSNDWTIPERVAEGFGSGPILVRQGTLLAHFVEQNEAGEISNDAINWEFSNKGSSRGYAGATVSMQTGYPNPLPGRAGIPARILWDLNATDEENGRKILEKWVDRIIAKYF